MSDYIEASLAETRALDAMCLVEQVFFGPGKKLYQETWQDGIYEFRQWCWELAEHTDYAWNLYFGEDSELFEHISFDVEYCEYIVCEFLDYGFGMNTAEFVLKATRELRDELLPTNNPRGLDATSGESE